MKYLKILTSISFLLVVSISAQGQGDCVYWDPEQGYYWDDCPPSPEDNTELDDILPPGSGGGDGPILVPTNRMCGTNVTIVSQTTFPCGSGYATEIVTKYSCTRGTSGTCQSGFSTSYEGCVDGELPDQSAPTVKTVDCN